MKNFGLFIALFLVSSIAHAQSELASCVARATANIAFLDEEDAEYVCESGYESCATGLMNDWPSNFRAATDAVRVCEGGSEYVSCVTDAMSRVLGASVSDAEDLCL